MTHAQLPTRLLVTAFIYLLVAASGARAQEANTSFLANLHQFRVSNYLSLEAYYRFSSVGDTETLNEIVANINEANEAMNSIADSTAGILSTEQVEQLNQEFDKFKKLMRTNINDVRNTGYPDLRMVSEMADQAVAMNLAATELYSIARENTGTLADDRVEAARSAAVTIAQMMAKYAARTHSQVAQTFQGSSSEIPLDEQARVFDKLLVRLQQGETTGDLKTSISNLSSKWQFIRRSYINFNDNNVAFVIDRYSKGILEGLETTIKLLTDKA